MRHQLGLYCAWVGSPERNGDTEMRGAEDFISWSFLQNINDEFSKSLTHKRR